MMNKSFNRHLFTARLGSLIGWMDCQSLTNLWQFIIKFSSKDANNNILKSTNNVGQFVKFFCVVPQKFNKRPITPKSYILF